MAVRYMTNLVPLSLLDPIQNFVLCIETSIFLFFSEGRFKYRNKKHYCLFVGNTRICHSSFTSKCGVVPLHWPFAVMVSGILTRLYALSEIPTFRFSI